MISGVSINLSVIGDRLNVTRVKKIAKSLHLTDVIIAAVICVGVYWMPLFFYFSGISISGHFEESVGYRYFYSLRLAFGHENVWLPQGQLVTLYHAVVQYLLTLFGLPNNQLFPRVDIFSMWAVFLPALLTGGAFFRLSQGFNEKIWPFLIGMVLVISLQSSSLPTGWAMMPDYHVWAIPLAVFSSSLLLHHNNPTSQQTARWYFGMGILIGMAAGIKFTFALYPLTVIAAYSLNHLKRIETLKLLALAGLTALLLTGVIFWACTGFAGRSVFVDYLFKSYTFMKTQSNTIAAGQLFHLDTALPFILSGLGLCVGIKLKNWTLKSVGLMGLIYSVFVLMRFYSHSLIEYYVFTLLLLTPLCQVSAAWFNKSWKKEWLFYLISFPVAVSALILAGRYIWEMQRDLPPSYRVLNQGAMEFHRALQARSAPIWILTSDNSYRPNSIESALCKGGMDITNASWGASKYIAALFPNFHCAVLPMGLSGKDKLTLPQATIGFSHWTDEPLANGIKRVEKYFDISLDNFDCQDIPVSTGSPLTYCNQAKKMQA